MRRRRFRRPRLAPMLSRCRALLDLALDSSSRSPRPGKGASMRGSPREERTVREACLGRGMRERSVCAVGTRGERGCGEERERVNMRCVGRRFLFYALHPHPARNSYSIITMHIFYFFSACATPCESCWKQPKEPIIPHRQFSLSSCSKLAHSIFVTTQHNYQ